METSMASFFPVLQVQHNPKSFSFELGATFRGLTISPCVDGYNIILRASLRDNTAVYSMTTHADISKGLANLVLALSGSRGAKLWHYDKYATGRSLK